MALVLTGLNSVFPHPLPPIRVHEEPQSVALFGNRVFADVVQLRRGHARLVWALNPVTGVTEGNLDTDTQERRRERV